MSQTVFQGVVKSVTGGDTIVVMNPKNASMERIFSFAYVTGPHLRKEGDEPYAFQSREFLRAMALSKPVRCTVLYKVPSSEREFGHAQLQDGTNLPDDLVAAGWLKVREDAGRKEESEDAVQRLDRLRALENEARADSRGLWGAEAAGAAAIEVQNDLGGPDFMTRWKGKDVEAIIERVLTADRMLVRLLLSDQSHMQVMTLLAGVRAPATARTLASTGQSQPAEEFGDEAKAFVEQRLHQRRISVLIVGASPQGQLIGAIIHPAGNIAEVLLREGLARCNDFHSTMLGDRMAPLRAAEREAQASRLRLHRNHVAKSADAGSSLDMVVSKIIGADTIMVRNKAGTEERRVNLSSVRAPRTAESAEAPFREDAKEYLRRRLIGKHVRISVDGKRAATDEFEARDVATVTEKGKNIGLELVQEGWCSVIRHRKDDTDRAPNYDELLAAQERARDEKKGMWSGKPARTKPLSDASETAQKAKMLIGTLQRQRKIPAVVDFCKSGSRFTIVIPREGVKLTMVLGGVRAPRAPRPPQDQGEPFGQEALDLANRRCNQRDCEVDIYDTDKVGGFIGDLYLNRESFAKVLVEEGLASVHAYSAERSGNAAELLAAEERAKEGRKGMWEDYDASAEQEKKDAAAAAAAAGREDKSDPHGGAEDDANGSAEERTRDYRDVVITGVDNNGRIKIQEIGKGTAALEQMMAEFKRLHLGQASSGGGKTSIKEARAGDYVAAKFSEDGQWYRARIRSNDRAAKTAEVLFIDYGNQEQHAWADLRPLDDKFSVKQLKAQAADASLTLVQLPAAPEYLADARRFIAELAEGKELVAAFDHVDAKEGVAYVTLYEAPESKLPGPLESVNREVVRRGHGMVPRKLKGWERGRAFEAAAADLRAAETQAKTDRFGMWEYGDITED